MQQQSLSYAKGSWSAPLPSHLDSARTLVLAFAAPEYDERDPQPLADLAAAFPRAVVSGCSTAGEIAGAEVHDASISVVVARFEHTTLRHVSTGVSGGGDSAAAGTRLAAQLQGADLRAVFVLSGGLSVNGTPLVDSLVGQLPPGVLVTGGLAGDGSRFGRTWVLEDGKAQAERVCAIGFYGQRLHLGHGCGGGWADFGPERRITRANGNVLYELNGEPALPLYKRYLGDYAAGLPGTALLFPLAVQRAGADQGTLVRTILTIDEASQSMTFAGDLPQGGVARLMRANNESLISSASRAGRQAGGDAAHGSNTLVISVSCVGRRLVLGERTDEEVEAVSDSLPAGAAHVGFYSYGEISPALAAGASELHNQTMTVTAFSEA